MTSLTDDEVLAELTDDECAWWRRSSGVSNRTTLTRLALTRRELREAREALNGKTMWDAAAVERERIDQQQAEQERDALRRELLSQHASRLYDICDKYADGGLTVGIVCGVADEWGDAADALAAELERVRRNDG